jgi:hypothetical protein
MLFDSHRDAIRDSRIASLADKTHVGALGTNGFFDCGFAQGPHGAARSCSHSCSVRFASRSVISRPPRFARDYSARATLVIFVETHWLRTSDAERDQGFPFRIMLLWKNVSSPPRSPPRPGRVNFFRLKPLWHEQRNDMAAVPPITGEMRIESEDAAIGMKFTQSHQARVC